MVSKHHIDEYEKFKRDTDKYNLHRADIMKKYKERSLKSAQRATSQSKKLFFSADPKSQPTP